MKKKNYFEKKIFLPILFLTIIYILLFLNISNIRNSIRDNIEFKKDNINFKQSFNNIENSFNANFYGKSIFENIYGFSQKMLLKNMIGNYQFIKDNNNSMHNINDKHNKEMFLNELANLKDKLNHYDIPLIYCQVPDKSIRNYTEFKFNIADDGNLVMDEILRFTKANDIHNIDMRNYINNEIKPEDIYFKTDLHMTTEAEIFLMKKLVNFLEENFDFKFSNKIEVFDMNNYRVDQKPFWGNLVGNTGESYIEPDNFTYYYPIFKTNYILNNHGKIKKGNFNSTILNFSEKPSNSYYVTDYLQWPSPYYTILNERVDNENTIVVIMDSLGLRTTSYLSLLFKEIIVLDPRYFDGKDYLTDILNANKVDAVVIIQSKYLMESEFFPRLASEIESENTPKSVKINRKYRININVKNTGSEIWNEDKKIRLCIWKNGIDYGYRINIPPNKNILPGETYSFILENYEEGNVDYDKMVIEYQMLQEGVKYFGEKKKVTVEIEK